MKLKNTLYIKYFISFLLAFTLCFEVFNINSIFAAEEDAIQQTQKSNISSLVPTESFQGEQAINPEETTIDTVLASLLDSHERTLSSLKIEVENLQKQIENNLPLLKEKTEQIQTEFTAVSSINNSYAEHPTEVGILAKQMRRYIFELNNLYTPLFEAEKKVAIALDSVSAITDNIFQFNDEKSMELYSEGIKLYGLLTSFKNELNGQLPKTKELIDKVSSVDKKFESELPEIWLNYYLHDSIDILNPNLWKSDFVNLKSLPNTIKVTALNEVPTEKSQWLSLLQNSFIPIFIIVVMFFVSVEITIKVIPSIHDKWITIIKRSLLWLALGVLFHYLSWSDAGHYQLIAMLGTFSLCFGQIRLGWELYNLNREDSCLPYSPFSPMLLVIVTSLILLTFTHMQIILSFLWLIFLVAIIYYISKRPKPVHNLPRYLLRIFYFVLIAALFMTLAGFVHFSIFLTIIYMCLAIGIHQVATILYLSELVHEELPKEGVPALVSGAAVSVLLPIVLLIAFLSPLLWVLAYPGGEYLIKNFSNFDFSIGDFSFNTMQIISILTVFYLVRSLIQVSCNYIDSAWQGDSKKATSTLTTPIKTVIIFGMWGIFGLYVLKVFGFSLTSLAVVAGGLSVGIGLGLQGIVQNIFSGFSLIFGQNIREGDVVSVGTLYGVVQKISLRATQVRTYDNAIVFVPNSDFLATSFTNWTHNNRTVRRFVSCGVAYGTDLDKVEKLVLKMVEEHPKVLRFPKPDVIFDLFDASSINFQLRFWVRNIDDGATTQSDVLVGIHKIFKENNIEIPFPQTDIHIKTDLANELKAKKEKSGTVEEKQKVEGNAQAN